LNQTAPVLTGKRIILRPHRAEDFERLGQIYATDRSKHIGGPLPKETVWRNFAADIGQWVLFGFGCWAIEERSSGAYVGQTGLSFPPRYPERELGWLLFEEFEGKGYAFEAASLARAFAFETLGWDGCVSYIDPDNLRSIRLAQRLSAVLDDQAATPGSDACLVFRHRCAC
jgi:RimJ/RimL family protein N-acetyltransferase